MANARVFFSAAKRLFSTLPGGRLQNVSSGLLRCCGVPYLPSWRGLDNTWDYSPNLIPIRLLLHGSRAIRGGTLKRPSSVHGSHLPPLPTCLWAISHHQIGRASCRERV